MSKINPMKKLFFAIISIFILSNCTSDDINNDILPFVPINETIDLSLPEYINIQTPNGWAYTSGGIKGIIIYNLDGTQFKAFERAAPHIQPNNCSQMIIENSLRMKCPCDDSQFNILNGSPLTEGISYTAREYLVTNINGNALRITNF